MSIIEGLPKRSGIKKGIPNTEQRESMLFSGEMEQFFEQLVDARDNYINHWRTLVQKLEKIYDTNSEAIHFGPEYHIGQAEPFSVSTIFVDYATPSRFHRDFILIAKNKANEIIGDSIVPTSFSKTFNSMEANLLVCMDPKNKGGAMPVNMAAWHLLELEAKARGCAIKWTIHNSNKDSLQELKVKYTRTKDKSLLPKISYKEAEQKRWQAMYGPGGKLNVGEDGTKTIYPKGQNPDEELESIEDVYLERHENDEGQSYPKFLAAKKAKNMSLLRADREAQLSALFAVDKDN